MRRTSLGEMEGFATMREAFFPSLSQTLGISRPTPQPFVENILSSTVAQAATARENSGTPRLRGGTPGEWFPTVEEWARRVSDSEET